MDEPDANVIYIHTPKTNEWISWMLNFGSFFFFCFGLGCLWMLLKISRDVQELLQQGENLPEQENVPRQVSNKSTPPSTLKPKPFDSCHYYGLQQPENLTSEYTAPGPLSISDRNRNHQTLLGLTSGYATSLPHVRHRSPYCTPTFNNYAPATQPDKVTYNLTFKNQSGTQGVASASFWKQTPTTPSRDENSSFQYYGMPRSTFPSPSVLSAVGQNSSTSSYGNAQRNRNADLSSDIFESMNDRAPFPDYYSFSRRP